MGVEGEQSRVPGSWLKLKTKWIITGERVTGSSIFPLFLLLLLNTVPMCPPPGLTALHLLRLGGIHVWIHVQF